MSTNPNTVKSQDDTTEDELGRTMTLLRAIEQLEKTECKLEKVEKQLSIAIKALRGVRVWANTGNGGEQAVKKLCNTALQQIEELNK